MSACTETGHLKGSELSLLSKRDFSAIIVISQTKGAIQKGEISGHRRLMRQVTHVGPENLLREMLLPVGAPHWQKCVNPEGSNFEGN